MRNQYVQQQESIQQASMKRKKRLVRRLVVFTILFFTICGLLISTLMSRVEALEEKNTEKAKLQATLEKLEKKQTVLKEEIVKLNDDEYIAKIARRDYFLSDEGEIIFNIPEQAKKEEEEE